MSYRITCDGAPVYVQGDPLLVLESPQLSVSVNTADSATWTVWPNHPRLADMAKLKSTFEISEDGYTLFRGRLLSDKKTFYGARAMTLEGGLAFLNDSVIRPFAYPNDWMDREDDGYIEASKSGNVVAFFLAWLLSEHNKQVSESRQLKLGNVTVTDPNNYITRASDTPDSAWDTVKDKLFGSSLGGYLYCRYEDDGTYVDYVTDFPLTNTQHVAFAENLVDFEQDSDGTQIYTAILPQGKTIEDGQGTQTKKRVGISDLGDGDLTDDIVKTGDYLYSKSGAERYGMIFAPQSESVWDDVTQPSILARKAAAFLSSKSTLLSSSVTVTAADLHFTPEEAEALRPFRNIRVESKYHGLSDTYAITAMTIPIDDPSSMRITIGDTRLSLTDVNQSERDHTGRVIGNVDSRAISNGDAIRRIYHDMENQSTSLQQTAEDIIAEALKDYVKTSDYDAFRQEVSTKFTLTAEGAALDFKKATEQTEDVNGDLQQLRSELTSYIRFTDGHIIMGRSDSAVQLDIDNDRVSFKQAGTEVAYISDSKLYITDAEITRSIRIGNFAWVPRENGNLSFTWVGGAVSG